MNELEAAVAEQRNLSNTEAVIEAQQLATLEQQIEELDLGVKDVEQRIADWKKAILDAQAYIRGERKRRSVLVKKRSIFARAAFDLREADKS